MICPNCNCNLEADALSTFAVHHCPQCSGTWIGGRALHAMLENSSDSASIEQILNSILDLDYRASRRQCASCAKRNLKAVMIENTELDFCSSCKGVFFDPGELQRVLPRIPGQSEHMSAAARPDAQRGFWSSLKRLLESN